MKHRLVLVSSVILAIVVGGCSQPTVQPQAPSIETANDDEERRNFRDELQGYLQQENFAKLEQIAHAITTKKSRFPGGDWKLNRFYENVGGPPDGFNPEKVDWKTRLAKLEKWTVPYPDSIYANVALASAQIGRAWNLRGRSFSETVDEKEFAEFQDWLMRAESTLNKMSKRRKECVAWYREMQKVCMGLGRDKTEIQAWTQEAVTLEPLYWDTYEGHALYLLPRWYGAQGEWEQFAEESSRKLDQVEGNILYSEICWQMSRFYGGFKFFQQNKVDWRRMKSGFIAREKRYGKSIRYLNAFALMAGSAADKTTTKVLMDKIGDRWEPDLWKEKKSFDGYKKWANE